MYRDKRKIKLMDRFSIKKYRKTSQIDLVEKIKAMTEEEILEALDKYKNELSPAQVVEITKVLSENKKVEVLYRYKAELNYWDIAEVIEGLSETKRLEKLEEYKKELKPEGIAKIIEGLSETKRLEKLEEYKKELKPEGIAKIIEGLSETKRLEKLEECKKELKPEGIAKIIKGLSEAKRLEKLEEYKKELKSEGIAKIIEGLSETKRLEKLEEYKKELKPESIAKIIEGLSKANKLEILKEYQEDLTPEGIARIIKGVDEEEQLKALKEYKEKLKPNSIVEIIKGLSEDRRIMALNIPDIKSYLGNMLIGEILFNFNDYSQDIEKHIKEFIEKQGFMNSELSLKIFKNLGGKVFENNENGALLTEGSEKVFGAEEIYSLYKYFVYSGEVLNVEDILKNPEIFNKYKEFRKSFKQEKQVPGMDTRDAILEFDKNSDLIVQCMGAELNETELKLFQAALREPKVKIVDKDDLVNLPQKRKALIEELINKDSQEALIYMLTGMSKKEYNEKIRLYVNDVQIDNIMQKFGDDGAEFGVIKAINEMINLVGNMEESKRITVLNAWNEDLMQEFTQEGSKISGIRKAFEDVEITIRKMYGRELSESLKENPLPKPGINGVIKLKGQKFKLLVHGILNGIFEKYEVGKSYISTSLISDKHLGKFGNANIYYGFNNIGTNALGLEGSCNIFSRVADNSTELTASVGVKFDVTDDLINETKAYNELVLWREYVDNNGKKRDITPDYVVCFDKITREARQESKRLKIPIVLIDSKAYSQNNEKHEYEEEKIELPKQYTSTQNKMLEIIREAKDKCSAASQREAMQNIVREMERQLSRNNEMVH